MSRFVDTLRSEPNGRLDGMMRAMKMLALRGSSHPDLVALQDEFKGADNPLLDVSNFDRMTHFYVDDTLADVVEDLPIAMVRRSGEVFRPLNNLYSLEVSGWLTFFVIQHDDKTNFVACAKTRSRSLVWLVQANSDKIHLGDRVRYSFNDQADLSGFGDNTDEAAKLILQSLAQTTMVMTVPGLYVERPSEHSPKLQARRAKRGKPELADITTLQIERPKTASESAAEDDARTDANRRVRHQVIGHFRLLTKDRPEPLLSFVPSHWRGDAALGVKIKNYEATKSQIPFNPPSLTIETEAA